MSRALTLVLALGIGAGCDAIAPPPEDPEPAHDEAAGSLSTAWVAVVQPADASLVEFPARIEGAADSRAHLDAPLSGTVVSVAVQVGDSVEVGDPLVELRIPAVLDAVAILGGASAQIDAHQERRERLSSLRTQGLVGSGDVFEVEASLGRLSAQQRRAQATLKSAGLDGRARRRLGRRGTVWLEAPIEGVVAELDATPGAVVDQGEGLVQILGRGRARIEVAYDTAPDPSLHLEFLGLDGSRFELAAAPVATAVEPGLGRTLAWYEPADGRALPGGVRGRVRLHGALPGLLEVPRGALRLHEGEAYVARRDAQSHPEPVKVEVLRSAGSSALVRSEVLKIGDEVAADVATVLMIKRSADELGGGHGH